MSVRPVGQPLNVQLREVPSAVIMQPTASCNLDCRYCYLPDRSTAGRMSLSVAARVADTVNDWAARQAGFEVFWHGGEPLAATRTHLAALMAPFNGVTHSVQTNATLIDDAWCDFFLGQRVRVGVSIDGPAAFTNDRRTRQGDPAFDLILKGAKRLRDHAVPFTALAVLGDPDPERAAEFYEFFVDLGAHALGITLEQHVGANILARPHDPKRVAEFWIALTEAWAANPAVAIREIDRVLRLLKVALTSRRGSLPPRSFTDVDPLPTVTSTGDVVLVSPELAGFAGPRGRSFVSGNVRRDPLGTVLSEAYARTPWLAEHLAAVRHCAEHCHHAQFCLGPSPAASYFETGSFRRGETQHCQATTVGLAEAVCWPVLTLARS